MVTDFLHDGYPHRYRRILYVERLYIATQRRIFNGNFVRKLIFISVYYTLLRRQAHTIRFWRFHPEPRWRGARTSWPELRRANA